MSVCDTYGTASGTTQTIARTIVKRRRDNSRNNRNNRNNRRFIIRPSPGPRKTE